MHGESNPNIHTYFSKEINPEPDSNISMNKTVLASSFLTRHLKYIFYMHIKQIPKENVIPKIYKSKRYSSDLKNFILVRQMQK